MINSQKITESASVAPLKLSLRMFLHTVRLVWKPDRSDNIVPHMLAFLFASSPRAGRYVSYWRGEHILGCVWPGGLESDERRSEPTLLGCCANRLAEGDPMLAM